MVDFRYHLVSLVSVFLALAIGIILGAGPLQNSIGHTLQDQVTELRTSRNAARVEAQKNAAERDAANAALDVAASQLIGGTLAGRNIAILVAADADSSAVEQAQAKIEAAGGTVVSRIRLEEGFSSSENSSYRNALAEQMRPQVENLPEGADGTAILASAIDTIARLGTGDAKAKELMGYFSSGDAEHTLITVEREPEAAADAVLLVLPTIAEAPAEEEGQTADEKAKAEAAAEEIKAAAGIYQNAFSAVARRGATVALGEDGEGGVLSMIRKLDLGSTVDSPGTLTGSYNTALALAAEIVGQHLDLGSGDGASAPLGNRVDAAKHE